MPEASWGPSSWLRHAPQRRGETLGRQAHVSQGLQSYSFTDRPLGSGHATNLGAVDSRGQPLLLLSLCEGRQSFAVHKSIGAPGSMHAGHAVSCFHTALVPHNTGVFPQYVLFPELCRRDGENPSKQETSLPFCARLFTNNMLCACAAPSSHTRCEAHGSRVHVKFP